MTIARIYVKNGLSVPLAISFPNQVFVFCFPADLFGFYSGTFDLVGGFNFLKELVSTCASFSTEWFNHQLVVLLNLATKKTLEFFERWVFLSGFQWPVSPEIWGIDAEQKWPWKNHPTAHPANEGGGSDSESEEEPPMKGMMQGAQFFFIDANGWFGDRGVGQKWGDRKLYGKSLVVPLLVVCWSFLQRTNMGSGIFLPKCPDLYQVFRNYRKKNAPDIWLEVETTCSSVQNFFILDLIYG